ncbi:isoprenylcysteine carboxylmethyltransferase family protein [Candidatus Curtissbacteria bacterium]|nr:isoprenylcysteine carboxylmethyltransferase family protein [Candidatus Curtissbacteria bacterium]
MSNITYIIAPIILSAILSFSLAVTLNFIYQKKLWSHDAKIVIWQLFFFSLIILSANIRLVRNNPLSVLFILTATGILATTIASLGKKSFFPFAKPSPTNKLITSGPYKIVRHPFYFATLLFCMAFVITKPLLIVFLFALMYILDKKANIEEGHLQERYEQYRQYQKSTKKLIPFLY